MIGFNSEIYLEKQTEHILSRIAKFNNKLYLEFGGKLFDDYHAARVLPGFDVNAKVKLLHKLKDKAEIIFCINAGDIERNKIRADIGITYDMDVMRLIDNLRSWELNINSVVITRYASQPSADIFREKLSRRGVKTYTHAYTKGYPTDVKTIVSDEGYGANPYIETTMPLVVVTAPGPGSGKLATCLSQMYHEYKRGVKAGYAKFETFPIWNLPLKHPVNIAYEAATIDLKDVNMIDYFHLQAYGETTVNYNRDIEVFPVVKTILKNITGESYYQSPTDMGVNMAKFGIVNDEAVCEASRQEIIRRYYHAQCDYKKGLIGKDIAERIVLIMNECGLTPSGRKVVKPAIEKSRQSGVPAMALELADGFIATGKTTGIMDASASVVLNAIKHIADISDEIHLISPIALEPIVKLKKGLGHKNPILNLHEVLIALSLSAAINPTAQLAMDKLPMLINSEAHSSNIISKADEDVFRRLMVNLTSEPEFPTKDLYFV
ncbi:MAG: DUF1846 domain-containing protein [Christensenellales bacterium]|jgi:uncharacterized protein (UPF0371 family)